jgi:hypothetical protein
LWYGHSTPHERSFLHLSCSSIEEEEYYEHEAAEVESKVRKQNSNQLKQSTFCCQQRRQAPPFN